MRRERKRQETERRFLTQQERLRERRQKRKSWPVARQPDGDDGSAAGDRRAKGMERQAVEFLSASER
jgi:hypothetical protein